MKRTPGMHRPAALTVTLLGAVIIAGAALVISCSHSNSDPNTVAAAEGPPLAARVDQLDGTAGFAPAEPAQGQTAPQNNIGWTKASVNAPVSVGSRIYARENSKVGIAFSGRNYARLNPNTSLDVLSLAQRRTQLALREGSCVFSVGALAHDELFEVGTPGGAVDFTEPGLYQVGIDDSGNALVSCLSGTARVVGLGGSGECTKGQLLTLAVAEASEAIVSQLSPTVAGSICNDYYSYRYPSTYDGRYQDYNRYLNDPYYYDPYRRSVSYQYIPDDSEVAGLDDLDQYGDWSDVPGHGRCWHPRESAGWAPYRDGSWSDDRALGLTWVATERWGWAPYHYGRWASVNQTWYWVPTEVVTQPVYSPALVAFVQMPEPDRVGWVPLGPGDPYVPRYYDRDYRPQYIGSTTVVNKYVNITSVTNYSVPGAVTVVRTTEFTGAITPAIAQTVDPAMLARTRPVMDPFAVTSVRQLAPNMMAVRPRVDVPANVEQQMARPVVISQNPIVPSVAASTVQGFKAQPVTETARQRKLQIKESGQQVGAVRPDGLPIQPVPAGQPQAGQNAQQQQDQIATQQRQARIAQLATQAAQGNKSAKQEMRQLQDEQRVQDKMSRKAAAAQGAPQQAAPGQPGSGQAQQAQSQEQRKAEKQAARQQAEQAQQQAVQQRQAQAAQLAAQQKAQKQAARQQAQQQAAQQQQQRQQEKAQRKAGQQPQAQQQPPQAAQQQQQEKAQRKAARQQAQPQAEQQSQQGQQQAAQQRRAQRQAQQQAAQQQAAQAQQQRQQQKAERRAARQQQNQNQQEANPSKAEKKAKNKNSGEQ